MCLRRIRREFFPAGIAIPIAEDGYNKVSNIADNKTGYKHGH
jgi:hypothetical protein